MMFNQEERNYINMLHRSRQYCTTELAHLYPTSDPDQFAAKCHFLNKLNTLAHQRLPNPDGSRCLWRGHLPTWYAWRWQNAILGLDLTIEQASSPVVEPPPAPIECGYRFLPEEEAYILSLVPGELYNPKTIAERFNNPYLQDQIDRYGETPEIHRAWLYRKLSLHSGSLSFPSAAIVSEGGLQLAWIGQRWIQLVKRVNRL